LGFCGCQVEFWYGGGKKKKWLKYNFYF
jgi:hypothetical protein